MDGKGSWRDNRFIERRWKSVKSEEVYLHAYDTVAEAQRAWPAISTITTRAARTRLLTARLRIWFTLPCCPSSRQRNVNPAELHIKATAAVHLPGATAGSHVEARELHMKLQLLNRYLEYDPGYVAPAKEALNLLGLPGGSIRPPLPGLNEEQKRGIKQALKEIGVL